MSLRDRVLAAWSASPARFREDANAEEDLALGPYRDRLVVELAQNAADAASRAGRPGRLLLRLGGGVLSAANTGAPLDAAGVEALATLRASSKRPAEDDQPPAGPGQPAVGRGQPPVGRFGVGFAAVLAVSDAPAVRSRSGGVRWSRDEAAALVTARSGVREEHERRGGHLPVLRLPFPDPLPPAAGFDTEVVLPLRDTAAEAQARALLAEVDAALLLALPALTEVVIEADGARRVLSARPDGDAVVLQDGPTTTRWFATSAGGALAPHLLADRPTEERARPTWSLTWAVPVEPGAVPPPAALPAGLPRVVHAPTPTDDPLSLPGLLIASFPLDPGRRRVAPGPLRDHLLAAAGTAYAALVRRLDPVAALRLVPVGLPDGEVDAALRRYVLEALRDAPLLPAAGGGDPLRPDAAVAVTGIAGAARPDALAAVLPGLVDPAACAGTVGGAALRALGVRSVPLADVVDALAGLRLEPAEWASLYAALDGADAEALGALPVPLADGRLVRGPRGLLLAGPDLDLAVLARLGLRVVAPEAAHPLLGRLGALPATPRSVLADPAVRGLVTATARAADQLDAAAETTAAVLALVAAAGVTSDDEPWLADLVLRDDEGEPAAPAELHLPGSPLARLTDPDAPPYPVAPELVDRWGADVLRAVGVLDTFGVLRRRDLPLDPADLPDLDGIADWLDAVRASLPDHGAPPVPPVLEEFVAVRDLDTVRPAAWPEVLTLLAAPPLRDAVTAPAYALLGDGRRVAVLPYTAWWLRTHPVLDGRRPPETRLPGTDPRLAGLYDDLTMPVPPALRDALGIRVTLDALLAEPGGPDALLARLAETSRAVSQPALAAIYRALAGVASERVRVPARLRAAVPGGTAVVDGEAAIVLDAPDLLPLVRDRPLLVVPPGAAVDLADLLAVPLASETVAAVVGSTGVERPVPAAARAVLPAARAVPPAGPDTWIEHERLVVDGHEVGWRVVDGVVHAATVEGLAHGLAWAAQAWEARHLVAAALQAPDRVDDLLLEAGLDEPVR